MEPEGTLLSAQSRSFPPKLFLRAVCEGFFPGMERRAGYLHGLPSSALSSIDLECYYQSFPQEDGDCLTARPLLGTSSMESPATCLSTSMPVTTVESPQESISSHARSPQEQFAMVPKTYTLETIDELGRDCVYGWAIQPATYDGGNDVLGCFKEPDHRVIAKVRPRPETP